ncbi:hypothetical protein MBAV_003703, partial [Candidatus Magnetobacterium bavaricum]
MLIIVVTVSLTVQDKSKSNTSSFTLQPSPAIEPVAQNKNTGCIEGNCVNGYGTYSYSNG